MSESDGALYDDGTVRVDDEGLLLRRYYFPLGRPRRLGWSQVRGYDRRTMGSWTGRHRVWGSHRPDWWFNADRDRATKHEMVVLDVRGVKPVITPDDPDAVCRLLDMRMHPA